MNLVDTLHNIGETYDREQSAAVRDVSTFTEYRAVAEHLADMSSVLAVTALTVGDRLHTYLTEVVGRGLQVQEAQDAHTNLGHVQHLAEAMESLARRVSELLGEVS